MTLMRSTLLAAALSLAAGSAFAGDVTAAQISEALSPKAATRSVTEPGSAGEEAAFFDTLRNRGTRSLSVAERDRVAVIAADRPKIDLEISFAYNSAVIGDAALPILVALGQALSGMKDTVFLIAGHTDGVGGTAFNQRLSERRAGTVKRFLVANYGIPAADLVTVGYGKSRLKDPANPAAAVNRRVQVANLSAWPTASR